MLWKLIRVQLFETDGLVEPYICVMEKPLLPQQRYCIHPDSAFRSSINIIQKYLEADIFRKMWKRKKLTAVITLKR